VGHKLLRDISGSVLVEYTILFPCYMLLVCGTFDVASMLSEWAMASKAAYIGARTAVVADAVASGITSPAYSATLTGDLCFNPSTGASSGNCPAITPTDCTGATSNGSCTGGYSWNDRPFTTYIFARMRAVYPGLQRQNVKVSYAPVYCATGSTSAACSSFAASSYTLGFVGQPGGLAMNVTVSITGMVHQFYFIGPIMRFFGGLFPNSAAVPSFSTTLPSEAMNSCNLSANC
jgi:Flp pilus assembly protein TadG